MPRTTPGKPGTASLEDARKGLWFQVSDPKRLHRVEEACRRASSLDGTATPTVTSRMVQLVLDTYAEHSELARDKSGAYTECAECNAGSYGPHTIIGHAREKAAEALKDVLRGEGS